MDPAATLAAYASALKDIVTVQRLGAGAVVMASAIGVRARLIGYESKDLVGGIVQGDRKGVLFISDLLDQSFPLPLVKGDRVVWNGRTMMVMAADDATRRNGTVSIAIDVQLRGG